MHSKHFIMLKTDAMLKNFSFQVAQHMNDKTTTNKKKKFETSVCAWLEITTFKCMMGLKHVLDR